MNQRRVLMLLAAGVVVIAVALWLSSQRHLERSIVAGQPVLPELRKSLNSIGEVRLIKGDGSRTTLKKRDKDWVVAERDFPADDGRVRKLLLDLSDLKVIEEKTRDPANYSKLGVEDVKAANATGTRVELAEGAKTVSLILGKPSGTKSGFVRVADKEQSLLAGPQVSVDADPRHWLDRTVLDLPQDRVKEVAVTPASGPAYTVTRASKEEKDFTIADLPKGRALSSTGAPNPIAGSLAGLSLDDVRKARSGTQANAAPAVVPTSAKSGDSNKDAKPEGPAHATFQTFDGLTLNVSGHKEGERHFVTFDAKSTAKETEAEAQKINARAAGWEIEIPGYKYDAIFRPLEDSLAKVETPAKKDGKKKS
jgi:Domain of unknown function (DUF4340)